MSLPWKGDSINDHTNTAGAGASLGRTQHELGLAWADQERCLVSSSSPYLNSQSALKSVTWNSSVHSYWPLSPFWPKKKKKKYRYLLSSNHQLSREWEKWWIASIALNSSLKKYLVGGMGSHLESHSSGGRSRNFEMRLRKVWLTS